MIYLLSKMMNHLIEGFYMNVNSFNKIKNLIAKDRKTKVIFVPIYKSYADVLILHYIHFKNDIEHGFTFGNYEDSPKIKSIDALL